MVHVYIWQGIRIMRLSKKINRRIVRKNQLTFTANEAEPIQVYKRPEIEGDEMCKNRLLLFHSFLNIT